MDILNFIYWVRGKRVVTSVDPDKTLVPLGVKDNRRDDKYLTVAMTVTDLANQLNPIQPEITANIWANGFIPTGCLASNITLPDNSTFEYNGPLSICTGYTLTVPTGTTLTVL
jgi:hypothetical protein